MTDTTKKIKMTPKERVKQYGDHINDIIAEANEFIAAGGKIDLFDPDSLFTRIDFDEDNQRFRDWCVKIVGIKETEYVKAYGLAIAREELGSLPASAARLLAMYIEKYQITMSYDETITRACLPFIEDENGRKTYIDLSNCNPNDYEAIYAECNFSPTIDGMEFRRSVRMLRDKLRLPFNDSSIEDAVDAWQAAQKADAKFHLVCDIAGCAVAKRLTDDQLTDFAERIFDCSEHGSQFVLDVLYHFIWQVKRKLRNMPIDHHLMPVLIGRQGGGKSTFVEKLLSPIAPLTLGASFKLVTDERNIDIWSSYVLFFDEMQHAEKADVEAVKGLITAAKVTRRPMRSNGKMVFNNNATFIGCSNKTLAQLIRDETGMRRFAELRFRDDADWEFINSFDWTRLWQSVDFLADAPIMRSKATLTVQQEASRQKSRVETWLEAVATDTEDYHDDLGTGFSSGKKVPAQILYQRYADFEDKFFPGSSFKMNVTAWGLELKRIMDMQTVKGIVLGKSRGGSGVCYWITDANGQPISGGGRKVVSFPGRSNVTK